MSPSAFAGSPGLLADRTAPVAAAELEAFRRRNAYWLDDWVALGGSADDQVRFEREWQALRAYAAERGVRVFGDMPIYVAMDGADHRAHPKLFQKGAVSGVPPDAFSSTGQLWGNPLYDWTAMRKDGYRWWVERMQRALTLVDLTRIDHFRGFVAYWAVPATPWHGRARHVAARPRQGVVRQARPRAPRRGGPRRDHAAGRAAAPRARAAGDGRAAVRARRRQTQPAPAREPRGTVGRLHGHARQRHDGRLVGVALAG